MKPNLITSVVILLAGISLMGCGRKVTNLNADPEYKALVGREFRTLGDFLLVTTADKSGKFVIEVPGTGNTPGLKELKQQFPQDYYGDTIHGILPKGSVFKIANIEKVEKFEDTYIFMYAQVTSGGEFQGNTVKVSRLRNDIDKKFESKYVEELLASQ